VKAGVLLELISGLSTSVNDQWVLTLLLEILSKVERIIAVFGDKLEKVA
jgi:hypothetical protein